MFSCTLLFLSPEALKDLRTKIYDRRNGDRPDATNIAIVVTDGESNIRKDNTVVEAIKAHDADIKIIAVGRSSYDIRAERNKHINHIFDHLNVENYI